MKTRLFIAMVLFACLTAAAQDNYMSLSFGSITPIGDYAKTDALTTNGFAMQGFQGEYSGAYYPIDYLGVAGSIKFSQNLLDKDAVNEKLLGLLPEDPDPGIGIALDLGYWSIISIGIGPQFTLPLGSKLNFDVYAFPGLHIVTPPKMDLTAVINGEPHILSTSSQKARFGYDVGLALRFQLSSTTGLRLYGSYLQTSSKGEIYREIEGQEGKVIEVNFSRTIQLVSAGIGIVYVL